MKRLFVLIVCLFCLSSCASMLEREATYTAAHVENPPAGGDTGYRVNTYAALRSALRSYVEEGMDEGRLRFPATYPGNLTVDLEKAKRQLMEEEPLGCYALEDVTFHTDRIVAFYEVTATFDYRVPPEEFQALETVRSPEALTERFRPELENFGGGSTLWLEWAQPPVGQGRDLVAESLEAAYNADPEWAVCRPALEVDYYPEDAARCIAEIRLTYPESAVTLRLRQRNMLRAAQALADELNVPPDGETAADGDVALAAYALVTERFSYDPEGGGSAADAVRDGSADDEGLARLWQLVCHLKGVETPLSPPGESGEGYGAVVTLSGEESRTLTFRPEDVQGGETP